MSRFQRIDKYSDFIPLAHIRISKKVIQPSRAAREIRKIPRKMDVGAQGMYPFIPNPSIGTNAAIMETIPENPNASMIPNSDTIIADTDTSVVVIIPNRSGAQIITPIIISISMGSDSFLSLTVYLHFLKSFASPTAVPENIVFRCRSDGSIFWADPMMIP